MFRSNAFRRTAMASVLIFAGAAGFAAGPVRVRSESLDRPPYYLGEPIPAETRPLLLPVRVVGPEGLPEGWVPAAALDRLAVDVQAYVADLLAVPGPIAEVAGGGKVVAPTVTFGCVLDSIGDCDPETARNELVVTDGTRPWRELLASAIREVEGAVAVSVEVRVSPQWIHQKNLAGKKEVRLGTGHVQPLPWVTSLDGPVWVVQLTGALVGEDGRVVRGGAEGVWALRTPFRASIVGAERLVTEEQVDAVRTTVRRDDLPERPLAWNVAARNLIAGLLDASP